MYKQNNKFILFLILFFLGCSSKLVVIPDFPAEYKKKSDFSNIELYITKFDMANLSDTDNPEEVKLLEEMLIEYIKSRNFFKEIQSSFSKEIAPREPFLTMKVVIIPVAKSKSNPFFNILAVYPGMGVLWPYTPLDVMATVATTAAMYNSKGQAVKIFKAKVSSVSSTTTYGLYKKKTLTEEAFRESYKKSFNLIAQHISEAHSELVGDTTSVDTVNLHENK
jgi:hypothetical protein